MDRGTRRQTDGCIDGQQRDKQADGMRHRLIVRQIDRCTGRQTSRWTEGQTDRKVRQIGEQADRETDRLAKGRQANR